MGPKRHSSLFFDAAFTLRSTHSSSLYLKSIHHISLFSGNGEERWDGLGLFCDCPASWEGTWTVMEAPNIPSGCLFGALQRTCKAAQELIDEMIVRALPPSTWFGAGDAA